MPRISIIIPAYNAEKYIERCMKSVLAQTIADFEVILVDDGSTDGSGRLFDFYASEDGRLRVIHQANAGLSAARNRGTELATGEYVTYIDSDDYVEPYYLEYLLRALYETGAQCVCAKSDRVPENELRKIEKPSFRCEKWTQKEALSGILTSQKTSVSSWNKLAPREWYIREPYLEKKVYEDLSNTYRIIFQAENVVFVDAVLYHYAMNAGSITGRKKTSRKQCLDYYEAINMCTGAISAKYPDITGDSYVLAARDYMSLFLSTERCESQDEEIAAIKKEIFVWFRKNGLKAFMNRKAPLEVRLRILLMYISPGLYKYAYYKGIKSKGKALG